MKKNIVFIGGSGLVGSALVQDKKINQYFNCINFDLINKTNAFFFKNQPWKTKPNFKKIERYNRTLNIQWAIDIKNSISAS